MKPLRLRANAWRNSCGWRSPIDQRGEEEI